MNRTDQISIKRGRSFLVRNNQPRMDNRWFPWSATPTGDQHAEVAGVHDAVTVEVGEAACLAPLGDEDADVATVDAIVTVQVEGV